MGIPSPLHTPQNTPLLKLKQLSPELPLQVVEEDDSTDQASKAECELLPLPPPSVDLTASYEMLTSIKPRGKWADANSDDSDSGDEQDSKSKVSTEVPRDSESLESRSTPRSEPKAQMLESRVASPTPSISGDILQDKGVTQVDMSSLLSADTYGNGVLIPMLCRIWRDVGGGMSVVPCMGDDVAADGEFEVFWCSMQRQQDGTALLTPSTDASACGIDIDASGNPLASTTEVPGAPKRPLQGSYAPTWIYGSQWPYCSAPTTLVLNHLPDDLLQEDLIEILDKEDFSGFYDFLYLPADLESGRNLGYAIVNLTRHEYGLALAASIHGRTSWCGASTSACQVSWSLPVQGLKQLLEHYRNHPANHESVPEDKRPTYFCGGWPRAFPPGESQ